MKHHQFYNTLWTERDEEFYWDGIKFGFIIGSIVTTELFVGGKLLKDALKNALKNKKEMKGSE